MRSRRCWLAVALIVALAGAACAEGEGPQEAAVTPDAGNESTPIQDAIAGFVPEADQFGLETFKIVYALEGQETGTRTMWVEDYGTRVGVEEDLTTFGQARHSLYYWDGERSHMRDLPDGDVSTTPIRTRVSEPTSFAATPAATLETVGYARLGQRTIAGRACEHWVNDQLNYEGCRADHIELEFLNGAGTDSVIQRALATELVEGEGIPVHITALAD